MDIVAYLGIIFSSYEIFRNKAILFLTYHKMWRIPKWTFSWNTQGLNVLYHKK